MTNDKVRHLIDVGIHWIAWPASGGAFLMFGQADGIPSWLANSSTLTGTAVLAWFAWHTVTRTIPEMQRLFREELQKERDNNYKILADRDGRHEREISEMWSMVGKLQVMLNDSLSSDRRAVHDMKDVAQTVISKAELKAMGG
jgi:hypothetical protein